MVLIFAAVVNGLIPVPYSNYTMLLVDMLQGSLTRCACRSVSVRSAASGPASCMLVAVLDLQRLGGQEEEFFGVEGGRRVHGLAVD